MENRKIVPFEEYNFKKMGKYKDEGAKSNDELRKMVSEIYYEVCITKKREDVGSCMSEDEKGVIIMNTKKILFSYGMFLMFSVIWATIFSTLFVMWAVYETVTINPPTLIVLVLMGVGWGFTALTGLRSVGGKNGEKI